ncbi:MAG TPA: bacterial transcriptional activator domain-containing protein [Chloroflexota bacterium]|nr:bacterial transcriptional activator domain-containing protein [Chloroflexota bacterium]
MFLWNGEHALAERAAEETISLEPFRETGYQRLMRVHAAAGNRAEALRAYERCRNLIDRTPGCRSIAQYGSGLSGGTEASVSCRSRAEPSGE